jgi:hypothetical protein
VVPKLAIIIALLPFAELAIEPDPKAALPPKRQIIMARKNTLQIDFITHAPLFRSEIKNPRPFNLLIRDAL